MLIRRSKWSLWFLQHLYNEHRVWQQGGQRGQEQGAINQFANGHSFHFDRHTGIVPYEVFNNHRSATISCIEQTASLLCIPLQSKCMLYHVWDALALTLVWLPCHKLCSFCAAWHQLSGPGLAETGKCTVDIDMCLRQCHIAAGYDISLAPLWPIMQAMDQALFAMTGLLMNLLILRSFALTKALHWQLRQLVTLVMLVPLEHTLCIPSYIIMGSQHGPHRFTWSQTFVLQVIVRSTSLQAKCANCRYTCMFVYSLASQPQRMPMLDPLQNMHGNKNVSSSSCRLHGQSSLKKMLRTATWRPPSVQKLWLSQHLLRAQLTG